MKKSDDKPNIAVALTFDGVNTPKVSATGLGELANEIIQIAKEHGVPLHEDAQLVELLSDLRLHEEIPPTLYRVVAEVIAFAYIAKGKFPKGFVFDGCDEKV